MMRTVYLLNLTCVPLPVATQREWISSPCQPPTKVIVDNFLPAVYKSTKLIVGVVAD
jgi:hypothetical protein